MLSLESDELWSDWYDGKNGLKARFNGIEAQLMWDMSWRGHIESKNCHRGLLKSSRVWWWVSMNRGTTNKARAEANDTVERCYKMYLADLITR